MKQLLIFLSAIMLLSSCTDYGEKLTFGKGELYYKGKGVTEKDAKKLGKYLEEIGYFESAAKTVQLTHDGEDFLVHLVVDEKGVPEAARRSWWKLQHDLSEQVFDSEPARVAFADQKLNDKEVLSPVSKYDVGKSSIYYDNSEIKKAQVKSLAEFLSSYKMMGEEVEVDVFVEFDEKLPIVRYIVNPKKVTDENRPGFAFVQDQMREIVFDGKKVKLVLTTAEYEDLDPLPKLTAEQKQAFLAEMNKTDEPANNYADTSAFQSTSSGVLRLPNE